MQRGGTGWPGGKGQGNSWRWLPSPSMTRQGSEAPKPELQRWAHARGRRKDMMCKKERREETNSAASCSSRVHPACRSHVARGGTSSGVDVECTCRLSIRAHAHTCARQLREGLAQSRVVVTCQSRCYSTPAHLGPCQAPLGGSCTAVESAALLPPRHALATLARRSAGNQPWARHAASCPPTLPSPPTARRARRRCATYYVVRHPMEGGRRKAGVPPPRACPRVSLLQFRVGGDGTPMVE